MTGYLGSKKLPKIPVTMRIRRVRAGRGAGSVNRYEGEWWRNYAWYWQCQLCHRNGPNSGANGSAGYNAILAGGRAHVRQKHYARIQG